MAIEMPIKAYTGDKVDFRSLLYASSSTYHQPQIPYSFGKPTSERWFSPIMELQHLRVEDSREATEEEVWAAYRRIEPHIENVIHLLADS